jgi:LysM repeat protein
MARRSASRWIAPLSLLGAVAAILIVISAHGGKSSNNTGVTSSSSGTPTSSTPTTTTGRAHSQRFYTVKPGDVLSGIAARTGVPLAQIQQLNPRVDAQSLQAGQKLKLVP